MVSISFSRFDTKSEHKVDKVDKDKTGLGGSKDVVVGETRAADDARVEGVAYVYHSDIMGKQGVSLQDGGGAARKTESPSFSGFIFILFRVLDLFCGFSSGLNSVGTAPSCCC